MSFKSISWWSWSIGFLLIVLLCLFSFYSSWLFCALPPTPSTGVLWGDLFCFDYLSFILSLLSISIFISLFIWLPKFTWWGWFMLVLSLLSSILCFSCVHSFCFWIFYEMSIFPLLFLLFKESPYSERYVALFYFAGYIVFGSLPLLMGIFYLSEVSGSFDFRCWNIVDFDILFIFITVVVCIVFITKIPLIPFHVWLPLVHAEASSPVSVCLSGYVMKLGILGIYRFSGETLLSFVFNSQYISLCLIASLLFFFCAIRELDVKRWLAFLSLGHISIAVAALGLGGWGSSFLSFVYCLGHGLSAAATFLFFWFISGISSTRNIMLFKNTVWGSWSFRILLCLVLGTVACVPPTIQFLSELYLIIEVLVYSNSLVMLFFSYVLLSGFIPILFLGIILTRQYDISYSTPLFFYGPFISVSLLVFWDYILFVLIY